MVTLLKVFTRVTYETYFGSCWVLIRIADFLYFQVKALQTNLIMFRDSSVTFPAKIRKN